MDNQKLLISMLQQLLSFHNLSLEVPYTCGMRNSPNKSITSSKNFSRVSENEDTSGSSICTKDPSIAWTLKLKEIWYPKQSSVKSHHLDFEIFWVKVRWSRGMVMDCYVWISSHINTVFVFRCELTLQWRNQLNIHVIHNMLVVLQYPSRMNISNVSGEIYFLLLGLYNIHTHGHGIGIQWFD